jgi:hypothetical protein
VVSEKYQSVLLRCILVGIVSFFFSLSVMTLTIRATEDVLNNLLNITVQLFGFGGVIFAVLYKEQRKMISEHRTAINQDHQEIKGDMTTPLTETPPPPEQRLAQIKMHLEAYGQGVRIYLEGKTMFRWGFLALGIGVILQLIERLWIGTVAEIGIWNLSLAVFLVSVDIALVAVGISSFVAAIWGSLNLPLGTNSAARDDPLKELIELRETLRLLIESIERSLKK